MGVLTITPALTSLLYCSCPPLGRHSLTQTQALECTAKYKWAVLYVVHFCYKCEQFILPHMKNKSGEKTKHLSQVQMYPQIKNSCVEVWIGFSSSFWGRLNTHLYNPKCFTTKLKLQNKCSSLILYLSDEYRYIHYFSRNESQVDHCCMLLNSYFIFCCD